MDFIQSFSEVFDLIGYLLDQAEIPDVKEITPYVLALVITVCFLLVVYNLWRRKRTVKMYIENGIFIRLDVPEMSDGSRILASLLEHLYLYLHLEFGRKKFVSLEIVMSSKESKVYMYIPEDCYLEIEQIANKVHCEITLVPDFRKKFVENIQGRSVQAVLELAKDFVYPIRLCDIERNQMETLLREGERAFMQIMLRPADEKWKQQIKEYTKILRSGKDPAKTVSGCSGGCLAVTFPFFNLVGDILTVLIHGSKAKSTQTTTVDSKNVTDEVARIEQKNADGAFETSINLFVQAVEEERTYYLLDEFLNVFSDSSDSLSNHFVVQSFYNHLTGGNVNDLILAYMPEKSIDILTVQEVADIIRMVDF